MSIPDKATFLALSNRGLLGNRMRSFKSLVELRDSGYQGFVTVRAIDKQSPWYVSQVHTDEPLVFAMCKILAAGGPGPDHFFFQEIPHPDLLRSCNIEAGFVNHQLQLYIERATTAPVRGIRERVDPLSGLAAAEILKYSLRDESWEMLSDIWERYPDAIIEATEFSQRVGVEDKHLVVWETRIY